MSDEADGGLVACRNVLDALSGLRGIIQQLRLLRAKILEPELVEVSKFDDDASEIVPHPRKNPLNFGVGFFRERGTHLFAAQPVFLE